MAPEFEDAVDKHGWNEIEKGIMWVWWEYIDPIVGPLLGYEGDKVHDYLNPFSKAMISVGVILTIIFLILMIILVRRRSPTKSAAEIGTVTATLHRKLTTLDSEEREAYLAIFKKGTEACVNAVDAGLRQKRLDKRSHGNLKSVFNIQFCE